MHTHTYTHLHTHTYIHTSTYMHTHTYIYIHAHTYIHLHTCTHIQTCTHTYTHTHTYTYPIEENIPLASCPCKKHNVSDTPPNRHACSRLTEEHPTCPWPGGDSLTSFVPQSKGSETAYQVTPRNPSLPGPHGRRRTGKWPSSRTAHTYAHTQTKVSSHIKPHPLMADPSPSHSHLTTSCMSL